MNAHSIWSSALGSIFSNSSSFPFILINFLSKETSLLALFNVFLFACSLIKPLKLFHVEQNVLKPQTCCTPVEKLDVFLFSNAKYKEKRVLFGRSIT